MDINTKLHHYIENAIQSHGENIYLKTASGKYSYRQLYEMALTFQRVLINEGIEKNDRVVIYSSKNAASIAMMIACSKCDCIYVPVSSVNPSQRAKYIINETAARFILCDESCRLELQKTELTVNLVHSTDSIFMYSLSPAKRVTSVSNGAGFILFTSGSTGTPKGVVISHAAAIAFIDWAAKEFDITGQDIMASIAPFNFDLSVFDIYVTAKKNATLLLYSEEENKNALLMAQNISMDKVTTIYGTPTFYSTLAYYGKLHKYEYSSLKNVLFAGEVFHLENFNTLRSHWPDKKYANLYGPTETNVCTYFKVDADKMDYPVFPIGKCCEYSTLILIDDNENEITENNMKGELLVAGRSVFNEYWNDPVKTNASFFTDKHNTLYYKTGDIVYKNDDGDFVYVARKDRMIKKNGYRIEPSEIEKVLMSYTDVSNVAVLFSKQKNQLICILECPENAEKNFIKLKQFCQNYLPLYMIPDKFVFLVAMPKTSSGKVDLQALEKQL